MSKKHRNHSVEFKSLTVIFDLQVNLEWGLPY